MILAQAVLEIFCSQASRKIEKVDNSVIDLQILTKS